MDQATLVTILGALIVAGLGFLGVRYAAKRGSSGGPGETAADRLWLASEKMRTDLTEEVQRLRSEVLTYRKEQLDALAVGVEKERTSRAEIEALTARVKDLEGQLTAALAEVASLRRELGRPQGS